MAAPGQSVYHRTIVLTLLVAVPDSPSSRPPRHARPYASSAAVAPRSIRPIASGATPRDAVDDGWTREDEDDAPPPLKTTVTIQPARTIIARNDSPDIPFDRSINPYQGCEHGCVYCYARPSHAYHDLSPGLDFETRLIAKPNAAGAAARGAGPAGLCLRADRARHQHRSVPADRARMEDHPLGARGARASASTRSRSSPRARWSSATST